MSQNCVRDLEVVLNGLKKDRDGSEVFPLVLSLCQRLSEDEGLGRSLEITSNENMDELTGIFTRFFLS